MKRIMLLGILCLYGVSLHAMRTMTAQEEHLFDDALDLDEKVKGFVDYVVLNALDVDNITYGSESVGQFLARTLGEAKNAGDASYEKRIESLIYPAIRQYRSNPPEADELRKLVYDALQDGSRIDDIKAFLQGKRFNIDRIEFFDLSARRRRCSIGEFLDSNKCLHDKGVAFNTLAILRLEEIKQYRTNKSFPLEELLIEACYDPSRFDVFKTEYEKKPVNVDAVKMSNGTTTMGEYLSMALGQAKMRGDTACQNLIENLIYPAIQQYRSNPPEANELRQHIDDAQNGNIAQLKAFLQGKRFNIDLIEYSYGNSIGYILDYWKRDADDKVEALNALAILRLDQIKEYRTNKSLSLEELLIETRFEASCFDVFKAEFEKKPVNVDDVKMSDGSTTMSEYLSIAIEKDTDCTGALKVAELVQPHRTKPYETFGQLAEKCFKDTSKFGALQAWVEKFPFDIDFASPTSNADTFAKRIDERIAEPATSSTDRAVFLRLLELMRPFRAKEMREFRGLFKKYEQDVAAFADLKKWFDEHPFDIDKVAYDPAEPKDETFGQRVNWLNVTNLRELFKAKRSSPNASVYRTWLMPKKMLCAALCVSAVVYYYYSYVKHAKADDSETKDTLPVAAVS